jgi:AraC-like DNA-binding protein
MLRDMLGREGVQVGRQRVAAMMKRMGIEALYRRPSTSKPAPGHKIYPYLLRGLKVERPNQVWAMDITYIPMARGFVYLAAVVDWFSRRVLIHTQRDANQPQRVEGAGIDAEPSLSRRLIALMERHLDFPLNPRRLAGELGISVRTLERHSAREFGQTPTQLYLLVRLQAARNLLFYEEGDIKDIAVACGFSYPSVFTRAFKAQFGQSPRAFRQSFRDIQGRLVRPEIARLSAANKRN